MKEHCRILIDDNEHFIMGLGTKGKTQRRGHTLRPNVYYELVDGIHLTLGDLKCQYYYSTTITREEEGEKEEKEVETGPDLNKTLPVDSDSTVTPSPRSAQLIPISPPTLPSFDNDAGKCCMTYHTVQKFLMGTNFAHNFVENIIAYLLSATIVISY